MPKSLDDLARIQQSYEKELANKKQAELETAQQKAVEATALAERKELAKKELVRHADLIEELRQLDEDAKRAEVLRIEERAKKAEELNKTLEERRVALDLLEQEAREAVDYFEKFTGFIAEKEQIAPEVLAAYKEAETVKQGLENDVANLASEIEKMSAGMATQEEIDRYKTLQKRIDELNQELESLIENPHVLEGLIEQGESEEAIKSTFIERVIQDHHAVEPERQKFLEDITRSFLEEELRSKGIAAIADPDERQKAIKTFVRGMYAGYHNTYIDEKSMDRGMIRAVYGILDEVEIKDHIKAECAGFALKSILYPNASGHLVMSHMRAAVDGTDPYQSWQKNNKNFQDRTKAGVEAHMGTLNLLLSYERGVRVNQHILGGKRSMWTDMSQSFFEMGFGYGLDDESRAFLPQITKITKKETAS